jgi:hypothetical protein
LERYLQLYNIRFIVYCKKDKRNDLKASGFEFLLIIITKIGGGVWALVENPLGA